MSEPSGDARPVLRETSDPTEVVASLDRAWSAPATFAFLPEKSGVDERWVAGALAGLPAPLRTGHFALLTSGSTGTPKLVVGERARADALARLLHDVQRGDEVAEAITTLPLSYCYSFVNQWRWARELDRRLVATRGFARPDELAAALAGARDAMLCLVAPQLALFERHLPSAAYPGVVRVHFAGGPFPAAELDAVRRRFPNARVFNNYGCAEAMPRLTVREVAPDGPHPAGGVASLGRPLPNVELRLDADGVLAFRSPYSAVGAFEGERFQGYDDATWVSTGDLAEQAPDGTWTALGRRGQVFKRYGEKVSLARLAQTVRGAFDGEVALLRERDGMGEEGAVLVVAPHPGDDDVRAIRRALRANHPRTHWPLRIESVERLPLLANGKVDLTALGALGARRVHWANRL